MTEENLGWIKLNRNLKTKSYYTKSHYIHLWIHLILSANFEPKKILFNNKEIIINPGQFLTGRTQLHVDTGIPETTIERILNFFENEHQIGQQKTNKFRLITITNWDKWQGNGQQNGHPADNKRTTDGQQNGHKQEVKKELKELKEKDNTPISPKGEFGNETSKTHFLPEGQNTPPMSSAKDEPGDGAPSSKRKSPVKDKPKRITCQENDKRDHVIPDELKELTWLNKNVFICTEWDKLKDRWFKDYPRVMKDYENGFLFELRAANNWFDAGQDMGRFKRPDKSAFIRGWIEREEKRRIIRESYQKDKHGKLEGMAPVEGERITTLWK